MKNYTERQLDKHCYNASALRTMAKMASERRGQPVSMREVMKRIDGDNGAEVRRIGKALGFEAEAEWWVQQALGTADEFKDALICMLKQRK